jgi:hypothetical protein
MNVDVETGEPASLTLEGLRVAQLELVFHPLYRLSVGVVAESPPRSILPIT